MNKTFSIDCMGGDYGPQVVLDAAFHTLKEFKDLNLIFFLDKESKVSLDNLRIFSDRFEIRRCEKFLKADDSLLSMLKNAKFSTMKAALQSVSDKESSAVFTVGHTGPYFILAKKILGFIKGVNRIPLAVMIPSSNGSKVLTDIGANLECSATDLYKFGLLGKEFIKSVLSIDNPGISLINVGHEENKGTEELRNSASLFRKKIGNDFKGFIDADKIFTCEADVIVTDGFSGNCISKACEGTSRFIMSKFNKYWIVRKLISLFSDSADRYNGAVLLGINGLSIKAHGSSKEPSLVNALRTTYRFASKADLLMKNLNSIDFESNELQ
ncbi:hypothetical protein FZC35_00760 [Candidatus Cytomitobacter indipagum]|uniref:Phosphate acyltransferase n=1 Tax=Candidatus Cytomitobacter indipagum TaxID=2601575 RepID=A0A5C0UDY9_9PROT|nr:hypothetical protein [Candidatus Cytomitobacter indipagum]QEK37917.1 hypothetical protein FZC35_00760 [Candidatus Cytomitobacter indipagum]